MTELAGVDLVIQTDLGGAPFILDRDQLDGAPIPGAPDLLTNGGFESALTGWTINGGVPALVSTVADATIEGAQVARVVGNGTADYPGVYQEVAVTPGEVLSLSGSLYRGAANAVTPRIRLDLYLDSTAVRVDALTVDKGSAGWGSFTDYGVSIPEGVNRVRVWAFLNGVNGAATEEARFDRIRLARGDPSRAQLTPPEEAWSAIECDVSSAEWSWGSTEPLGPLTEVGAGRIRVSIIDPVRLFDPSNATSPYAGIVHVGSPIRVLCDGAPAFTGTLDQWDHDLGSGISTLSGIDAIGTLAAAVLVPQTIPAGNSDAQAIKVLDVAAWYPNLRRFEGDPAIGRLAFEVEGSALDALQQIRFAELADLFAGRDGAIVWRSRTVDFAPEPSAIVNCGGALLGALSSVFARNRVRNVVVIDGATPEKYTFSAPVARHDPRTVSTDVDELKFAAVAAARPAPRAPEVEPLATQTITADRSSLLAVSGSTELGGGQDQHLPAGSWSGYEFRGVIGFPAINWAGVSSVIEARLHMKTTTQVHVGFSSSPRVEARRITASWTPNGASSGADGGSGWSTSGLVYPGPSTTTSGAVEEAVPGAESDWTDLDVTAIVRAVAPTSAGGGGAKWYGINIRSASGVSEFYSAEASSGNRPYLVLTLGTNKAPGTPVLTAPIGNGAAAGTFSARLSDPEGDPITQVEVIVREIKAGGVTVWAPGASATGIAGFNWSRAYAGTPLTAQTYAWKLRARDAGAWGPWSAEVQFFPGSLPATPEASWAGTILDALGAPAVLTRLGTIRPRDAEVVPIVCAEFGDRWRVVDDGTVPAIDRTVRVLGETVSVSRDLIEVDAITEDV